VSVLVFDHTALLALGTGNRMLSQLIDGAHHQTDRWVYAPAMCLAAAVAARPALADHVGALPAVDVVDLGYAAAATAGACIAAGADWRVAHAVDVGRPSLDWPTGCVVVTSVPEAYTKWGVETLPITG
jgi:hypothetical protein